MQFLRSATRLKSQMADGLQYLNSLNTRRYRCCCGTVHVKRGALVVGTMELLIVSSVLTSLVLVFLFTNQPAKATNPSTSPATTLAPRSDSHEPTRVSYFIFAGIVSVGILYVMCVLLMFVGVRRGNARFVLPHLVAQLLLVLILAACITLSILVLAAGHFVVKRDDPEAKQNDKQEFTAVIVLIFSSIFFGFQIWFSNVVYKCYCYLRDRETHLKTFGKMPTRFLQRKPTSTDQSRAAYNPTHALLPWIDAGAEE